MDKSDQKQDEDRIKHKTHIGSVIGQVHSGSGDINVGRFSVGNAIANKEEFLATLREFKAELSVARKAGLPEDTSDDAAVEIEAAEREVNRGSPAPDRIMKRLEKAKDILVAGASAATAANTVVENLVSLIHSAIQHAPKLFGG